jgi:hypothetical protein
MKTFAGVRIISKPLQIGTPPSTSLEKHEAQVEVQLNSLENALRDLPRRRAVCSIGAPMSPAANSPTQQTAAPERSLDQRMDALQKANVIRSRRAQLKRDLKAGRVSIHTLLLDPPEFVETAKVFDMLLAVPKYGRVKANKILQTCRISPSKTIGGLSDRQRAELVGMLHK